VKKTIESREAILDIHSCMPLSLPPLGSTILEPDLKRSFIDNRCQVVKQIGENKRLIRHELMEMRS
jgi:hypothetical protein